MLDYLNTYLEKAATISEKTAWFQVINRDVQFEIIRLNTDDQLYEEGVLSDGSFLPDYSETSVNVYGKSAGHITLKDTGEFYQSFIVKVNTAGIMIVANDVKDDTVLSDRYGIDILGLTEENLQVIREMLKANYINYIYEALQ